MDRVMVYKFHPDMHGEVVEEYRTEWVKESLLGMLQRGAVYCSVLQCVAVWCSVLQCVVVRVSKSIARNGSKNPF